MTVFEGSRYRNAAVVRAQASDGKKRPTLYYIVGATPSEARYRNYTVQAGETLDMIAYRLWRDPELWWRIANINPEILYPDDIPPGTVVRLPA